VATSKFARERVLAPYLRTDFAFLEQRLKLVAGVRGEKTEVRAQGPLRDPRRNADGIERGSTIEKTYDKLFPSLNASYAFRENLIARLAAYESIGRPDYNQYAGGLTLPDTSAGDSATNRIVVNNIDINPWSARSLVLRLEHYFEGVGVVSVAAFRRDVRNFFGSTVQAATPEFLAAYGLDANAYGRYGVSTQFNLPGTVRFEGVSFTYPGATEPAPPTAGPSESARRVDETCTASAGCAGALTSVMNAVTDALARHGVPPVDMPATPLRLFEAIRSARA
jgi:outer membrane receptor protein involved in Fe transport